MFQSVTTSDNIDIELYVARPDVGVTVRGGLIIVQEIFGVNSQIRSVADKYAQLGYISIAPALFDRFAKKRVELG